MFVAELIFWILIGIIFYSYIGYGLMLWIFIQIKSIFNQKQKNASTETPDVTLIIPAYNEKYIIDIKMQNCLTLNYPKEKLKITWITDGSDDGSDLYIQQKYPDATVWHQQERKGKSAAVNRALCLATTEIIIFCDANTILNNDSVKNIISYFNNAKVGAVAGEKRVLSKSHVAGAGESFYWQYESWLKKLNSGFYTTVGAVGELFALKKSLATPIPEDSILDDFVLSMQIADNGYKIAYAPNAYALEAPSENETEEMKRKIRIAAGAFQCLFRYPSWLNFFKHPLLSFQYFSHKVLRWAIVPLCFIILFVINIYLIFFNPLVTYKVVFFLQVLFYLISLIGIYLKHIPKILKLPAYVVLMNSAMIKGFYRYIANKQSAVWEKVKRET